LLFTEEKDEMEMIRSAAAVAFIAAAAWFPSTSEAARNSAGWYAGAEVGNAKLFVDDQIIIEQEDLSDTVLSLYGGYRFGRHFAVEGTLADLGDFHYTAGTCGSFCIPELALTQFQHSATRLDVSVVGAVPLGEWLQAYGRVGLASTNLETVTRSLAGTDEIERNDLSAVYGVGLRASFGSPWSVRLQWNRSSQSKGSDLDVGTVWLGAEYQFGGRAL
jgi:opacity protein-like surface antigen